MKKLRKLVLVALALLLALSLSACSGGKTEPEEDAGNPLYDVNVRLAILYGVDREAIVEARDDGVTKGLYGFVPTGLVSEEGDFREVGGDLYTYDLEKAKEYLAKAGYSTEKPLKLEYYYNQNAAHDLVAAMLKSQLAEVGIEVVLKTADTRTFFQDRSDGNYQIARGAMSADYNDALTYLDMATSTYQGHQSWGDKKYDELMFRAAKEEGQTRIDTMHEAEHYLVAETAQVCPLFEYGSAALRSTKVSGDFDNFQGNSLFWFVKNEGSDTFTYAVSDSPNYMDPAIASDSIGSYCINQMFFPLYYLGPNGITPAAAAETTVSEDGLVVTIKLLENYWSDGQKVTAADYVYGVKHALSIGSGDAGYLSWITDYIVGAKEYDGAQTEDMPNLGVVALDDDTIQYTLVKPLAYFTSLLWGGVFYPLRADFAPMGDYTWADTVGYPMNGAFVPNYIDRAAKISYEKNPYWVWKDQTNVDSMTAVIISDMDAQLMAFQTGEIDFATSVEAATVSKMPELADSFFATGIINYYVQINCFNPAE